MRSKCECCGDSDKEIKVSFCPECKSRDVGYAFGLGNLFGVIPKMRCKGCGFSAVCFPVLVTSEKKLKASIEDMKAKKKSFKKKVIKKKKVVKRK